MVKSIKDGEVAELKQNTDIISIVSNYVSLKKSGKNFMGLCPFHKEKTPSFVVDPQTQLYHCFGCGNGGDVISFIMKTENLSFVEAVELIAKKTGYTLKYVETGSIKKEEKKSRLFELNELAGKYYNFVLFKSRTGRRALSYLRSRKISDESLRKFDIGYSQDSWDNFIKFAHSRNFTDAELVETGLCTVFRKDDNRPERKFDRFRGRIIFPIKDLLGRTIGFGGRIIPEDFVSEELIKGSTVKNYGSSKIVRPVKASRGRQRNFEMKKAKYVNSPETKIYSKSRNLYGIFEAKNNIVEKDLALIVEGYIDVISLYENKIYNSVASLGTALTSEQIKLIGRFTKNIVLIFDSDRAGMSASVKGIERLKEYNENLDLYNESNISIRVCILEKGFDPADYVIQKGVEKFLKKIEESVDIIDFSIDNIIRKYNIKNLTEKLRAANELLQFISSLSSSIIQEECIKKIAGKLNLKESMLLEEMLRKKSVKNNKYEQGEDESKENPYEEFESRNLNPQKKKEIEALQLLVHGHDTDSIILDLSTELFRFEDTRKLFEKVQKKIRLARESKEELNFPLIISSEELDDDNLNRIYNYIYFSDPGFLDFENICQEVGSNLKKLFLSEKIELLKNKISSLEKKIKEIETGNMEEIKKEEEMKLLEEEYLYCCKLHIELENKKNSLETDTKK
ncbi:MAG TPA: toprim domain-containing protein [Actinobacteria bacterium]|nr:toprim domain-containing protein [Actinomycetota bacterium]